MEKSLKLLHRRCFRREFCIKLLPVSWHLGNRQLMIASQNLLWWLGDYEKEQCRQPMKEVSEKKACASTFRYLFKKLPELGNYLICSDAAVDFKESIPLERRLELSKYVTSLPVRLIV